jgi:DNA-binding response OmpR family regulator
MNLDAIREKISYQPLLLGSFALLASGALAWASGATGAAIAAAEAKDLRDSLSEVLPSGLADNDFLKDTVSVDRDGQPVTLSAREFALLRDLLSHKNHIRTRAQLEESLYAWGEETGSNTVEVYVHHLRKKLGADFIRTVRGLGYQLGDAG